MKQTELFHCLNDLCKLGSIGWISLEKATAVVRRLKESLCWYEEDAEARAVGDASAAVLGCNDDPRIRIRTSVNQLMSYVDSATRSDIRLECGCFAVAILQEILYQLQLEACISLPDVKMSDGGGGSGNKRREYKVPPAPPCLISMQQTKLAKDAARLAMYTTVLGCLDVEASAYVKMTLAKTEFVLGTGIVAVPHSCRHNLLASIMKILLSVMKHETLGAGIRASLFPEMMSAMMQLCFSPSEVKDYPEDVAFFREQHVKLMDTMDTNLILQHLLLLLGIGKIEGWFGKVCRSLVVRRFLMKPGGVGAVIGSALAITDKQKWQRCEAVATLVAQAKIRDVNLLFTTLGPQLVELMGQDKLKAEVLHVVVLIVAQLAVTSATLTALHITNTLLQPLINTTLPDAPCLCRNSNLTACVSRIHKIFVEIPPPNTVLTDLLRPVLKPLIMIASLATTHLRTLARQIILRCLSNLPREVIVERLLVLFNLKTCAQSPPVNPEIKFSIDDDGGVKVDVIAESVNENDLEEDENLCTCLVSILESLNNSAIVLLFYEKMVFYIDFTVLNIKKLPPTALVTDTDVQASKVKTMRNIIFCCDILTHLSESEQITSDLFVNLSAAVPVVDTLINKGCQKLEDKQLEEIQVSLIFNVLMLVMCYVSERTLRKKMTSEDWKGLKSLLPSLKKIEESSNNDAVLLINEKLRNLVLTHGIVNSLAEDTAGNKKTSSHTSVDEYVKKPHDTCSEQHSTREVYQHMNINEESCSKTIPKENNASEIVQENLNRLTTKLEINNENYRNVGSYKEAMEELFSPLLPVRGHALLALGKLIEKRDEETVAHKDQLFSVFQHNLKDDDSYLYLMAVEGLAVLCDALPEKVIEILTQEFSIGNRSVEDRVKLVEALTRAARRLGSLLPHFKDLFINAFLNGVRDEEALIRAASLSGLGEVFKLLRFSLGPIVHEVFGLLYNVVKGESAAEVRRAAVLVVTLLLQGLGRDAFSVLQEEMRDLYRALRLVHKTDPDDVVRLHAQLALTEIDIITRQFLIPKLNLAKRIYVTEMPPSTF
ncbi:transport and Golgi organization protein 6 homolog [Cherax quadricarinatus]|nr:transport and Golgi organization protein 6 homolog [Cherax quadricarinatus]